MEELRLTASQAIIAERLLLGESPAEIAKATNRKYAAVNSMIRACYTKADVSNRAKFTAIFFRELLANE